MRLYRCAACGETFEGPRAVAGAALACPLCGGLVPVESDDVPRDLVIDVRARAEDGSPLASPQDTREDSPYTARPTFEQRNFAGRLFPGGPTFQGQTWVFRSGGPGGTDGRGGCGCGCILALLFGLVFLRGCAAFFQ